MRYQPVPRPLATRADYTQWSIEELWELAAQMRLTGARTMSRRELIDLFVPQEAATKTPKTQN
jgi:hypothetical protein